MLSRRSFLEHGALCLSGLAGTNALAFGMADEAHVDPIVTFAILTDVHYADKPIHRTRHYRDSIEKMRATAAAVRRVDPDFAIELGDLMDTSIRDMNDYFAPEDIGDEDVVNDIKLLKAIDAEFAKCADRRHYVFGNRCVDILTKEEFAANCAAKGEHYSFSLNGVHFVVLDACFNKDGEPYGRRNFHWKDTNIPTDQLDWLSEDLAKSDEPAIIFTHQRLDPTASHSVKNHRRVREVLTDSGRVMAVLQGHSHFNAAVDLDDIHYVVFRGMVEGEGLDNNGYALVRVFADGSLRIEGFHKQVDYELG